DQEYARPRRRHSGRGPDTGRRRGHSGRPAGPPGGRHAQGGAGDNRRRPSTHRGRAPPRGQTRCPSRPRAGLDPPHVGRGPHHVGAGAGHHRKRGRDARPGIALGLRAVPDAERDPSGRPVLAVARRLPRARTRCPSPWTASTAGRGQMMDHRTMVRRLLLLTVSIGLASRTGLTDTTQYYALDRAAGSASTAVSAAPEATVSTSPSTEAGTASVTIGVGPVIIPAYLDRTEIVTRTAADRVEISMFHRWAEPLADSIARTVAEEIASRVP